MNLIRYCFECGHIGEVPPGARDCCPDGNHAVMVPQELAEQAQLGFNQRIGEYLGGTFQQRVKPWMKKCFGDLVSGDKVERNHRFLEEALELVQAGGCTIHEVYQLVHYVFNRPKGELHQEVGGVMVTLAALCLAQGVSMHSCGELELSRINNPETIEKIRAKQATKPRNSALPGRTES